MPSAIVATVEVKTELLRKLRDQLTPKQLKQALYQSILRATQSGATMVKREVKDRTYITQKYITRVVKTGLPKGDPPAGKITISQKKLPLTAYRATQSKKGGVTVKLSKGLPPIKLRHAFIATVKRAGQDEEHEGHLGVFVRTTPKAGTKATAAGYAGRLKIKQLYGPSVLNIVSQPEVTAAVQGRIGEILVKRLQSQLDRFTK